MVWLICFCLIMIILLWSFKQFHACDLVLLLILCGRVGHHRSIERHSDHTAHPRRPQGEWLLGISLGPEGKKILSLRLINRRHCGESVHVMHRHRLSLLPSLCLKIHPSPFLPSLLCIAPSLQITVSSYVPATSYVTYLDVSSYRTVYLDLDLYLDPAGGQCTAS